MPSEACGFHRARSPEQVRQRRKAILDTASDMLREAPVAEISLRELSSRVGLAKSNVLRYFDSREAIFLEILDREQHDWLDELEQALDSLEPGAGAFALERAVAQTVTDSIVRRPLLCELVAAMGGVLERNISFAFARDCKHRATENTARLAALLRKAVPSLSPASATMASASTLVFTAGLWPFAQPTEQVRAALADMGSPPADVVFREGLRECLATQLVGLRAREGGGDAPAALLGQLGPTA